MTASAPSPRFNTDRLRALAGNAAFDRGRSYYSEGRVTILSLEAERVLAKVAGSETYRAALTGQGSKIDGTCNCPAYDEAGFCKHLVAVGLAANEATNLEETDDMPPDLLGRVRAFLGTLPHEKLVELLVELAASDDALLHRLNLAAGLSGVDDDDAILTNYRQAINAATQTHGYVDYDEAADWATMVDSVLDAVAELIPRNKGDLALRLIEHAISRISDALNEIDDSNGEGTLLLDRLTALHLEACGATRPDPVELARDLFEREMEEEWGLFRNAVETYATILGESGLAEYRRLAAADWEKLPSASARTRTKQVAGEQVNRHALGRIMEFFAKRDGDIDALIAIKAKNLTTSTDYLRLAEFCLENGRQAAALTWAEDGIWLFEDEASNQPLIELTTRLLAETGQLAKAEKLLWKAFTRRPNLSLYQYMRRHLGASVRERCIDWLRNRLTTEKAPRYGWETPADLPVQIMLAEGLIDDAFSIAKQYKLSNAIQMSLAQAGEASHPARCLEIYTEQARRLVSETGNHNYERAWDLIRRMARLQNAADQARLIEQFRAEFKAKRNFIKLLTGAKP
jgi:uncharacterized Zn finger protein